MATKKILITGATDGIGKLTALRLAQDGHELYIHGRDSDKLSHTVGELQGTSGNENIFGIEADFAERSSIQSMIEYIQKELTHLDILINNVGVFKSSVSINNDGIDLRIMVNYLAPYLLTESLLPLIKKGSSPRIINLSSAAQSTVLHDALFGRVQLSEQESYAQSKLALTMWSFYLAKTNPSISTIAVNPGSLLNTKMVREAYGQHWSPADKGASILYDLALAREYEGVSGKYFDNDKGTERGSFSRAHEDAYNALKVDDLIATTNRILSR